MGPKKKRKAAKASPPRGEGPAATSSASSASSSSKPAAGPLSVDPTLPGFVGRMSYPSLQARRDMIRERLVVLRPGGGAAASAAAAASAVAGTGTGGDGGEAGPPPPGRGRPRGGRAGSGSGSGLGPSPSPPPPTAGGGGDAADELAEPRVPLIAKTDVHWDFVLKEMMWLSADFQSERKAHAAAGRKVGLAVKQFHKTKGTRKTREMAEFEVKRRRLAARMARDVRAWWAKVDRVVAHKQKSGADARRRKEMDRHLVYLVKQTERYGKGLAEMHAMEMGGGGEDRGMAGGGLTIEGALRGGTGANRASKAAVRDYTRVRIEASDSELYGTSTADDSDDYEDASDFSDGKDDVTTLVEAERIGNRDEERDEAKKLLEESQMDIEQVLARLSEEAETSESALEVKEEVSAREKRTRRSRRVQFSPALKGTIETESSSGCNREQGPSTIALRPRRAYYSSGDGSDADDDADASDVEDFDASGSTSDDSADFEVDGRNAVDDETTLEAEERMGREMSASEEIAMLNAENEMSVEELRAKYAPKAVAVEAVKTEEVDLETETAGDTSGSEEFEASAVEGVDDETTMEAEERMGREMSASEEIAMLNAENEMSVEELRAKYAPKAAAVEAVKTEEVDLETETAGDTSGSEEFEASAVEGVDDETTMEAEERIGREMSASEEIAMLNAENEMSVEELRAKYAPKAAAVEAVKTEEVDLETETAGDTSGSEEFEASAVEGVDDETTMEAEERMGREMSASEEIAMLNAENEMSVEELRAKYAPKAAAVEAVKTEEVDLETETAGDTSGSEEFEASAVEGVDDETTMEAEERMGREMSASEEIAMLNAENEMSVEELRAKYAPKAAAVEAVKTEEVDLETETAGDTSGSEEFEASAVEGVDDETTMEAEERMGREMSASEEIAMLNAENEMSVEELRAKYADMNGTGDSEKANGGEELNPRSGRRRRRRVSALGSDSFEEDDATEEEEFRPGSQVEVDDEATLEVEERLGRDITYREEIELLKQENEMSIEEVRAKYPGKEEASGAIEDYVDAKSVTFLPGTTKRKLKEDDDFVHDSHGHAITNETKKLKTSDVKTEDESEVDVLKALEKSEATARETMVSRPFLISSWVKLRAYQQVGLNWLVSTQGRRLNGILADEMGLGKTLQTISLLAYLACYKGIWGPHLIIVPTSCLVNWESEIKRFCPGFKVLTYYGSAKRRKELRVGWTKPNFHHIVVTSYQLAVQDAFAFRRKKWYYLILDEAHNIKNFQSQRWQTLVNFNTQRRLLLTGTPLQNNLMELWSLLHFLMPHIFRSRKEFSYWFSNPMNNIIEGNTQRNDDLISRLHGIIRPFVLRRLKKDVETQMPGKFEHIVKCQLSRRQMFLYEEFMARSSTRTALDKGGNYMGMMSVLMQLRKVCNHPDLFEPRTVVTPFFMERVTLGTAGCVVNAIDSSQEQLSGYLMYPLWSCGRGVPDFSVASTHDQVNADALNALVTSPHTMIASAANDKINEPDSSSVANSGLANLLRGISSKAKQDRVATIQLQSEINSWRCQSPAFPISERLVKAVHVQANIPEEEDFAQLDPTRIASTPKELMAMRRSQHHLAEEMNDVISKFVFCVPTAGARSPVLAASKIDTRAISTEAQITPLISRSLHAYYDPFCKVNARLTSFFPDKKLVQFDAGKLQTLSALLYDLKRNGHRVLIFTQMSKMLDILEVFLNLYAYTYLRLDGATGVDKRQRMMDRFNNDTKVFCFILSTRSGGLGINLTGADTVIFYDSDWNPAMDAQAQDRAHRIGQTRDVHIYRLVTEHTIEENILTKAKQKRHLDFLVMDQGNFHASASLEKEEGASGTETSKGDVNTESPSDVFTTGGLRDILGVKEAGGKDEIADKSDQGDEEETKEQIEKAMAALEDDEDAMAMRVAKQEVEEEMKEFDETVALQENPEEGDESSGDAEGGEEKKSATDGAISKKSIATKKKSVKGIPADKKSAQGTKDNDHVRKAEEDMDKEFAEWQNRVGSDMTAIDASLKPAERYGLRFREEIDPFYSAHFFANHQRMQEATVEEEWNVEQIEQAKDAEEKRVLEEGDLLATLPELETLPRQRHLYHREKTRLKADKKRRRLTGENWSVRVDALSKFSYWYNSDTGEATWDKPRILFDLEAYELASKKFWSALPIKPLVHVMSFLVSFPDRMKCAEVSPYWRRAANDFSFIRHVLPVEMGALVKDKKRLEHNHFHTIAEAVAAALPGDTIELGDGHYWIKEPGLKIEFPLRIIGDEKDPSHATIELGGTIVLNGGNIWMEGVSLRRPRIASGEMKSQEILHIKNGGRFDMLNCMLDNDGCRGSVARLSGSSAQGRWDQVEICGAERQNCALSLEGGASVELHKCRIWKNHGDGVLCSDKSSVKMHGCVVKANDGIGVCLKDESRCEALNSNFFSNKKGNNRVDKTSSMMYNEEGAE